MAYEIGSIVKGVGDDCHYQMLGIIQTLANANGWTTLRYVSTGTDRELILQGEGLTTDEQIFIGFKCYQSVGSDYYNINCGVFGGFLTGNAFEAQPNGKYSGVPAHNNAMTYYLSCNAQRITGCFKVATPVYEHFYLGKFFPYARPSEFPAPLITAGMFNGAELKRYSDTSQQFPYPGVSFDASNCFFFVRSPAGTWDTLTAYPFMNKTTSQNALAGPQGTNTLVPAGTDYQMEPIIIQQPVATLVPSNVWGELDGLFYCSGFSNATENVIQVGGSSVIDQTGMTVAVAVAAILAVSGRAFVMLQNVYRTTWRDYIAMELK